MKTKTALLGHTASPITAHSAAIGLAHRASVTLIALIVALLTVSAVRAHGQASITSPSRTEALPLPAFTLRWNNVGQVETFLYLGSQQGANDYYGASMGTAGGVNLTWNNAPAFCWIRLWSKMPIYSGTSGSTVAYYQWQARDYLYYLGKLPSDRLVDAWIARFQADSGRWGGQCKSYLQSSFASVVSQVDVVNPNETAPFMPINIAGYYWAKDLNSGFTEILKVYPSEANKLDAVKAMLRQVKRGDVIQYGTQVSVNEGLHSLAITADYDSSGIIRWADSNWVAANTVSAYQSRSVNDLAAIIARDATIAGRTYPKGATLYRVRRDLKY